MIKKNLLIFFIILFGGCSFKNKNLQGEAIFMNISSPSFKLSDSGFLYHQGKNVNLELYKLGQPLFSLKIDNKICIQKLCYTKKGFNQHFFKNSYYDDLLFDILVSKEIFKGENLQKNSCGFTQQIGRQDFDIVYEVCGKRTIFKDSKNNLHISFTRLD